VLVVGAPGEIGLSLDINDASPSGGHRGGDLGGTAEAVVSQIVNGQSVDLTHPGPIHVDHEDAVSNELADLRLQKAQAIDSLRHRPIHVLLPDHVTRGLPSPVGGLPDQVGDVAESCAQLALTSGQSHTLLHHRRHRLAIEGRELLFLGHAAHELRIALHGVIAAIHDGIEIRLHLEYLSEIRIERVENLVGVGIPEEHDFHVHVNRLRLHGG